MDSNMLAKLMAKKKGEALDPEYKNAKMGVLKDLHGEMSKLMGSDIAGLKKVTVASDDASGLKEGLDKAKEMLAGKAPEGSDEEEAMESPEEEKSEMEDPEAMSPEELQAKIDELQAVLKAKSAKI